MQYADQFAAMGTTVDVVIEAEGTPLSVLASIRVLFGRQEAMFSRFCPESLLSRLNRGEPVEDSVFAEACQLALRAFALTDGLFNPMILPALSDAGYDRTFAEVRSGDPCQQSVPDPRECLVIDGARVRTHSGQVDLGGIVKGWTVDIAANFLAGKLRGGGIRGAIVNAGGDLRTVGREDGCDGWWVEVEGIGGETAWSGSVSGALATSSTARRKWMTKSGQAANHIIDPRTGLPAAGPAAQVSVWGAEAWQAECWAKAILLGGSEVADRACAAGYRALRLSTDDLRKQGV